MFPIAHAGHWITGIAYFLPILFFLGWLGITNIKERRAGQPRTKLRDFKRDQ
jgi:hypothetical protein